MTSFVPNEQWFEKVFSIFIHLSIQEERKITWCVCAWPYFNDILIELPSLNKQVNVVFYQSVVVVNSEKIERIEILDKRQKYRTQSPYLFYSFKIMSVSSPEISLSSSSTTSSTKEDVVDYWEVNPVPEPPSHLPQLASMNCWDYAIEFDCLKGPEGRFSFFPLHIDNKFY